MRAQLHTTRGRRVSPRSGVLLEQLWKNKRLFSFTRNTLRPRQSEQVESVSDRKNDAAQKSVCWREVVGRGGGCLPGSGLAELNTLSRWARAAYLSAWAELTLPPAAVGLLCGGDRAKDPKSALHDLGKRSKCAKVAPASPDAAPPPSAWGKKRYGTVRRETWRAGQVGAGGRSQAGVGRRGYESVIKT